MTQNSHGHFCRLCSPKPLTTTCLPASRACLHLPSHLVPSSRETIVPLHTKHPNLHKTPSPKKCPIPLLHTRALSRSSLRTLRIRPLRDPDPRVHAPVSVATAQFCLAKPVTLWWRVDSDSFVSRRQRPFFVRHHSSVKRDLVVASLLYNTSPLHSLSRL